MTALSLSATRTHDDFDQPILRTVGEALYDAQTVYRGSWALMTHASWAYRRKSARLGTGRGQKYVYDGTSYLKVEG
jgi:hypothetical protein